MPVKNRFDLWPNRFALPIFDELKPFSAYFVGMARDGNLTRLRRLGERRRALDAQFEQLRNQEREAIRAATAEGYSISEISGLLGITRSAVRKRLEE